MCWGLIYWFLYCPSVVYAYKHNFFFGMEWEQDRHKGLLSYKQTWSHSKPPSLGNSFVWYCGVFRRFVISLIQQESTSLWLHNRISLNSFTDDKLSVACRATAHQCDVLVSLQGINGRRRCFQLVSTRLHQLNYYIYDFKFTSSLINIPFILFYAK